MESQGPRSGERPQNSEQGSPDQEPLSDSHIRSTPKEAPDPDGTIVVKIGGSTFGDHDTTLEDLVVLQRKGIRAVVVHGGGKTISDWMIKQGVRPRFVRGLRVTDKASLEIVVAVLTGLVNKQLVGSILSIGGKAVGLSGVDGRMLQCEIQDPELGLVGRVKSVDTGPIQAVLDSGSIPIIAPVAVHRDDGSELSGSLLNVNADAAAGEIAAALDAKRLVFLTDVEGVLLPSRRLISRLTERRAMGLVSSKVVGGGMIPKLEACLKALGTVDAAHIIDGRRPRALLDILEGKALGTRIG